MAEEPTLPRRPAGSGNARTPTFAGSKKRVRPDFATHLFSNSSDPAIFSSDDDPALDNYVQGRPKKRYVGAWFAQRPAPALSSMDIEDAGRKPFPPKRTLERQFDSGVWMDGDGIDVEAEGKTPESKPRQRRRFQRVSSLAISPAEKVAREVIQTAIEEGIEDVDL